MDSFCRHWLRLALVFATLLVISLLPVTGRAQTFRGTILGTVTDTSGASIVGAKVIAHNVNTGVDRTTETNADGEYRIPELPIGTYTVTVEKSGFQPFVTPPVTVRVTEEERADAVLKPAEVSQKVEVSGEEVPQIETTTNILGGTLTASVVKDLPVNGRDYTKLIYLTPGITGSPDQITDSPGSFGVFSMNGARGRANNFLLDGTDMNDGFRNDPAINEAGVFGTPATILPVDAIAELKVQSNFEPEFGRNAGAVLNIVTKSGTNDWHGAALEYFRNNALDARNFFNSKGNPQASFHNNQFGGSLGGPIVHDKTFFYGNYEGQRERVGFVSFDCVPDPAQVAADVAAIRASGGMPNPVTQALLARSPWPQPNIPGTFGGTLVGTENSGCPVGPNASVVTPSFNDLSSFIGKLDHNFNQNNILTGRYFFGDSVQSFPLALTGGGILPGFNTFTPTRVQLVSISYLRVLSPTKLNEARMGWNRFAEGFFPQDQTFHPSSIGLCAASATTACAGSGLADQGLPVISVSGFSQIGASKSVPRHRVDTNWQAFDNFSWKIGRHDLKMGYEFRRTSISQNILGTNFRGKLSFNSLTDFLNGNVASGSQSSGNSDRNTFENSHAAYIQDSFHLTSRFTINAGVRWDYFGVIDEKHSLFSNFDPATGALVLEGTSRLSQLYKPDYKNFGPRVSAAWDAFGKGKTVLRAGWGIFYDAFSQDFFLGHLPFNCTFCPGPAYNAIGPAPIFSTSAVGGTIVPGMAVFMAPGPTPGGDIFSVDRHIKTPYMENYNVNIEQQLFSRVVLQVGYVGSQGHRLFRFVDLNQPTQATIDAKDSACNCIVAFDSSTRVFGSPAGSFFINQEQTSANSNYNSLQTSLRVNGWHGLSTQANFVWSHSIDGASDGEDFVPNAAQPNDSTRPNLEKGNSNFDVRRRFTWNYVYEFPSHKGSWSKLTDGWGLDGILSLQDGQPFHLNFNFEGDYSGSGQGFDRPDVVGPITINSSNPSQFLVANSFAVPCRGNGVSTAGGLSPLTSEQICVPGSRHFGDMGRNSLRGPAFKQLDFSIFKNTKLTERLNLQLRAEVFNILNHPNFSSPYLPLFIADALAGNALLPNGHLTGVTPALTPTTGFMPITTTGDVGIGNPFLGGAGPRGIQLAAKFSF